MPAADETAYPWLKVCVTPVDPAEVYTPTAEEPALAIPATGSRSQWPILSRIVAILQTPPNREGTPARRARRSQRTESQTGCVNAPLPAMSQASTRSHLRPPKPGRT